MSELGFCSSLPLVFDSSSAVLFVHQHEVGIATPKFFDWIGSDDATTCVIVFLRNPSSGLVHCVHWDCSDDSPLDWDSLLQSGPVPCERFQLWAVGGIDSPCTDGMGASVVRCLFDSLHAAGIDFETQVLAVGEQGLRGLRGAALNLSTLEFRPANLTNCRTPLFVHRSASLLRSRRREFSFVGSIVDDRFFVSFHHPGVLSERERLLYRQWSVASDDEILQCSTSPHDEASHFATDMRNAFKYLADPHEIESIFGKDTVVQFELRRGHGWTKLIKSE